MKDSGRQKDRQRWERKEWASLVEKHPRRVKASPWGLAEGDIPLSQMTEQESSQPWKNEVDSIFGLSRPSISGKPKKSGASGPKHRVLTSNEVFEMKVAAKEEKERKEKEKQERKERALENKRKREENMLKGGKKCKQMSRGMPDNACE